MVSYRFGLKVSVSIYVSDYIFITFNFIFEKSQLQAKLQSMIYSGSKGWIVIAGGWTVSLLYPRAVT